jgi:hypothetical protein
MAFTTGHQISTSCRSTHQLKLQEHTIGKDGSDSNGAGAFLMNDLHIYTKQRASKAGSCRKGTYSHTSSLHN